MASKGISTHLDAIKLVKILFVEDEGNSYDRYV